MKIPKSFSLGAVDWYVEEQSPLPGLFGVCLPDKARICLDADLPQKVREQTFCHEAVHAILFAMGKTNHDEEFVDAFGVFLHQYLVTAK